jgi:capsid protein
MAEQEGGNVIDGIQIDPKTRRRLGYWVRTLDSSPMLGFANLLYPYIGSNQQEYTFVKAENMIHLFKRFRPGLQRGVPSIFCVGNDLHDLSDLQNLEMKACKSIADLAKIWITKTGEAPDSSSFRNVPRVIYTLDANGNPIQKPAPVEYDVTQGGKDTALKPGEKVETLASDRPSVAAREFWDYLTFRLCAGMGISRLLVAPYAPAQGTVVRTDLDCNTTFFRSRSRAMMLVARKIYRFKLGWGVDWDRRLIGAPPDWKRCKVRPPRSITADVGHNSEAVINEYNAGLRTAQDIYQEAGEDLEEKMAERDAAWQLAKAMSEKSGTPIEYLLPPPKSSAPPPPGKPPANGAPAPAPARAEGNGALNRLEQLKHVTSL